MPPSAFLVVELLPLTTLVAIARRFGDDVVTGALANAEALDAFRDGQARASCERYTEAPLTPHSTAPVNPARLRAIRNYDRLMRERSAGALGSNT